MAYTLADWAREKESEFLRQQASLGWFQRFLCKRGIHRWHRLEHMHQIVRGFCESSALLKDLPMKKTDGHEYPYVPRS